MYSFESKEYKNFQIHTAYKKTFNAMGFSNEDVWDLKTRI